LLFGQYGYVELSWFLKIKNILSCMLSTVHSFASFMVIFSVCGKLGRIYEGVYMVEEHSKRSFYPKWMAA
jgi:hypothetical protein